MTPELWPSGVGTRIAEVVRRLQAPLLGTDGLTISGGEPFEQSAQLVELLDQLRQVRDVEVLVYTGNVLERLREQPDAVPLLARTDILVDGPYVESLPNTLKWRGSDNQRVHLLSSRAQRHSPVVNDLMPAQRRMQLQMLDEGGIRLIGIPNRGDLARYQHALASRGLSLNHPTRELEP